MEITTSFVFLRADVDKCLRLVLLLPVDDDLLAAASQK